MEPRLLFLISDLMQDRGLRFHFNQDPRKVMQQYQLTPRERRCLLTMDRRKIGRMIARQFKEWGFPDDGLPVDESCLDPGGSTDYPSPVPRLFKLDRPTLQTSAGQREFRIFGQSFAPNAKLELKNQTTEEILSEANWQLDVRGTYRCSEAFVYLTNPASIPADTYQVKLHWGGQPAAPFYTEIGGLTIVFN